MKKRVVFISNMAAPYQVKLCRALQKYFNAEFWFHVHVEPDRPSWWKVPLGDKCKILGRVLFAERRRYLSLDIVGELNRFDPDVVVLGGYAFPSLLIAYLWAKLRRRKVVMFVEIARTLEGVVRKKGLFTRLVHWLYVGLDEVWASAVEGAEQWRDAFGFGDRVLTAQYPADIDEHLKHPLRERKDAYTYLYANRLTLNYCPLKAIDIFNWIRGKYPGSKMFMNASGELLSRCRAEVWELGLDGAVFFLTAIASWDDLHEVYRMSDILLLPAEFSAGNLTVVEAMASGMGIVVSDKVLGPGIDCISSGQNGFICSSDEDYWNAVDAYHKTPYLLRAHGYVNKAMVERYSVAQTAALWWRLLEAA